VTAGTSNYNYKDNTTVEWRELLPTLAAQKRASKVGYPKFLIRLTLSFVYLRPSGSAIAPTGISLTR
jgi:hypothetical protein